MHKQFLLAALAQARLGQGQCAPNPCVGAVAVQNGTIIAQAFHQGAGTPHAEHLLLAQLPPKMLGVCVYVTLEPCNHWGKTPPCVNALIEYGVEEVVFGFVDPNPIVAQKNSSALLQQQGIIVTYLPLAEIAQFYQGYAHWLQTNKPLVHAKIAHTLDGKIGLSQQSRVILSNELCAEFTHAKRDESDIIITTAKTISADNPHMNVRLPGVIKDKPVAIIDTHLRLRGDERVFSSASHCHIFHRADYSSPSSVSPRCSYYPIAAHDKGIDLQTVMVHLGVLGFHQAWVEAGGRFFSALHQEHLVDKTYIYITPSYLGESGVLAYQNTLFDRKHQVSWQIMENNVILCLDWLGD